MWKQACCGVDRVFFKIAHNNKKPRYGAAGRRKVEEVIQPIEAFCVDLLQQRLLRELAGDVAKPAARNDINKLSL